jgi:hypothetical protein
MKVRRRDFRQKESLREQGWKTTIETPRMGENHFNVQFKKISQLIHIEQKNLKGKESPFESV